MGMEGAYIELVLGGTTFQIVNCENWLVFIGREPRQETQSASKDRPSFDKAKNCSCQISHSEMKEIDIKK